ncbi:hypothetical protein [Chenggangzhangella methanolivorans]|uniref:Uncharacterized protein n=1 Tax=Chenggangzhangella methanolivorans TaxID=1437009 RepID=A0A9E6RCY6_9HYPH|nr:hypothetical protein [Chenggangzhangella methanolivorans]QZO00958.1 hypothetical protein K6K41_04910 [Chenggangzhangella methanolivorans]
MASNDPRSANVMADVISSEIVKDPNFVTTLGQPQVLQGLVDKSIAQTDGANSLALKKTEADRDLTQAYADSRVYLIAVTALSLVSVIVVVAIGFLAWRQVGPLIAETAAAVDPAAGAPGAAPAAAGGAAAPDPDAAADKLVEAAQRLVIAIPDGLVALGSAAIGALAGLLGPLSSRR